MGRASTLGLMAGPMKGSGKKMQCMGKGFTDGGMAEFMKVNTKTIKNLVSANILGQTEDNMKDSGKKVNSTGKESMS